MENNTVNEPLNFSIEYMDFKNDPAENFYKFSNGKWLENAKIPDDKTRYESFSILAEKNLYKLKLILEELIDKKNLNKIEKMVSDFYKSGMNTKMIEKLKFEPLKEMVSILDDLKSHADLPLVLSKLSLNGIDTLFGFGSEADEKNSEIYAFYLMQSGLSLPDRDYYLNDQFKDILKEYEKHIKIMLDLYGYENPEKFEEKIVNIEKKIAEFSRSRVDLRDPEKNYNKQFLNELSENYKNFDFTLFLNSINFKNSDYIIIGQTEFLTNVIDYFNTLNIDDIKNYLFWKILNSTASLLHKEVRDEDFRFYKKILLGQEKQEERWKTIIKVIDASIGEAMGELYVKKYFPPGAKERMMAMVSDLEDVFKERLKNVEWMTPKTKEMALKKFSKFNEKIGYPEKFRDYSSIKIDETDYFGNVLKSGLFEMNRQMNRIGNNVDKTEWEMTPPTVNAYFNPLKNEIVFPAGILQPPFFDNEMDDAVNYGGIGGVISHEITHGYDDQGRHFDENGNLVDWWSEEDARKFDEYAEKVVKLYGSLEILPEIHVNGKLTLGEDIADLGGVYIAYNALENHLKKHPELNKKIDNLTPEQRFFISWSQVWRGKIRENEIKRLITIDPHAPSKFRGEIPVWNHEKFEETFKEYIKNDKKKEKIKIW